MATAIWELGEGATTAAPCRSPNDASASRFAFEIDLLAAAALADDALRIDAVLAAVLASCGGVAEVLTGPVTAAARRLGDFWITDSCDFVAVTMATWQLRRGAERLIASHPGRAARSGRRALFAAVPGDQHGFGAFIIDEVFARAGWITDAIDSSALIAGVAAEWIDLVGLTATADRCAAAIAPTIAALRRASRNPQLAIIVGGRLIVAQPALATAASADGMALDAPGALMLADRLVTPLGRPS